MTTTEPSPASELRTAAATLLAGKPEHPATFADEYPDLDAALAGVLNMQATGLEYDPDWNGVELPAALATARRINAGESAWALSPTPPSSATASPRPCARPRSAGR